MVAAVRAAARKVRAPRRPSSIRSVISWPLRTTVLDNRRPAHVDRGLAARGDDHTPCHAMTTRYTSHFVVEALYGYQNGEIRQRGKVRQIC